MYGVERPVFAEPGARAFVQRRCLSGLSAVRGQSVDIVGSTVDDVLPVAVQVISVESNIFR